MVDRVKKFHETNHWIILKNNNLRYPKLKFIDTINHPIFPKLE
jgi:hypothetical protein